MNRILLAILFALGMVFVAAPAEAAGSKGVGCKLTNTGIEPDASGQAKIAYGSYYRWDGSGTWIIVQAQANVICKGLVPNATYRVWFSSGSSFLPSAVCQTDATGQLQTTVYCESYQEGRARSTSFYVAVFPANGASPVLEGGITVRL